MRSNRIVTSALMLGVSAALFAAGAATAAEPAPAASKEMRIVSFTGQVQIKIGNEVIGIVAGGKIPVIPPGAVVTVLSGQAVFQSGNTTVQTDAGGSFTYSVTAAGVQLTASPDSKANVSVTVGGTQAVLTAGAGVAVTATQIQVTSGEVAVTSGGITTTLTSGQTADTTTTTTGGTTTDATTSSPPPPSNTQNTTTISSSAP